MELTPQFNAFLAEIRPTVRQKEDWRTGSKTLRDRLEADDDLKSIVVATFLQGSVRRATAVKPMSGKRPDVDIVVATTLDYTQTTPDEAMKKFVPFLDKYYKGKWRRQDRSFGIELSYVDLDLVITALPIDPSARRLVEALYRSDAVLTNDTLEDAPSWKLNKSWSSDAFTSAEIAANDVLTEAAAETWKPHPLWLPDRAVQQWGRTHPLAQIQWTSSKNQRCNRHYVNLVRAVKWWRLQNADDLPKYPKGYPLEHMVGASLGDGTQSMAQGVVEVFETMAIVWAHLAAAGDKPTLADHGVPEHDVLKRLEIADFKAFHAAAKDAADKARAALNDTDAQSSAEKWRGLFGPCFPLPPSGGGDRPKGFVTPGAPAQPKTERFA